jgi:hypothetical protein
MILFCKMDPPPPILQKASFSIPFSVPIFPASSNSAPSTRRHPDTLTVRFLHAHPHPHLCTFDTLPPMLSPPPLSKLSLAPTRV